MGYTKRKCDYCKKEYLADNRNLKRGWGKCCSKSCAAHKREKSRPDYCPETVKINNAIRSGDLSKLTTSQKIALNKKRYNSYAPSIHGGSGIVSGITSEGYRVMDGVAYNEWDEPVYNVDPYNDTHPLDLG